MNKKGSITVFSVKKEDKMTLKPDGKTFRTYHKGYILRKKKLFAKRKTSHLKIM